MKRSVKHLPKRTQEELNTLLELIKRHIPWCSMIILYGSYARGGYILWDQRVEFGINTSYQSDYDIMVVIPKNGIKNTEDRIRDKVMSKYHATFEHRRHASPQFIVENVNSLNKKLESSQYFFTDIAKEGIKMYDTKEFKLAKPRELSFAEIKKFAEHEYSIIFPAADDFLTVGKYTHSIQKYVNGSFQLHQSCERFYNTISLVFTNYLTKSHKLNELGAQIKEYSRDLASVFPQNTPFEERCYALLCRAYIEARYNSTFIVTKEELSYIIERTEILKEITARICQGKIASYDCFISAK